MSASALLTSLDEAPTVEIVIELARTGLGDVAGYEREGGDGVGTDEYEVVLDAWPRYRELLGHGDREVRMAAAWLLSMLVEPAGETLPALEAAVAAADAAGKGGDDRERAAMRIAAARLRATVNGPGEVPWDGIELDQAAAGESALVRGAIALGQVFGLPDFPRKCRPEVAEAIDGLVGAGAGPWGGGDLGALAASLRPKLWVQGPEEEEDEDDDEDDDDHDDDDEIGDADDDEIGDAEVADPYTQRRPERGPPRVVLDGLHDVAWAELEHAYGPASGVPGMIEALSSADPSDRAWALDALDASIHHQGSVYPASEAAAPFLVTLVGDERVDDRHRILELLCGLAVHQPSGCVVNGSRRWRSEAFEAVAAGGPTYVRLLGDGDARVRTGAAFVLAHVEPVADGALDGLRAALAVERDRRARSSLLLTLGYVSRYLESRTDAEVLAGYLDDRCLLLAVSAAAGLTQMFGADVARPALDVLDRGRREAAQVRGFWPWKDGDLRGLAEVLRLAMKPVEEVVADLDGALAAGDAQAARASANKAFWMLFRDENHDFDHPWLPAELDEPRRKVLAYYVDATPAEDGKNPLLPFWDDAGALGLPGSRDAVRRLLGQLGGAGDAELGGRPAWAALYAVLVEVESADDLHAALAGWSEADRVALVEDALDGPLRLPFPRRPTEYGVPGGAEKTNDHVSRFLLVCADVLTGAGAAGRAWAERIAAEELPRGNKRRAVRAVLAALVLGPDADDRLIAIDQAPGSTYRKALRVALSRLPEARVLAVVGDQPLWAYRAHVDPRGEVRRWQRGGGWDYLDLLPRELAATRVRAALAEYRRHREAGDDRDAQPVAGTTTSTIEQKPPPDEEFPFEQARAYLDESELPA